MSAAIRSGIVPVLWKDLVPGAEFARPRDPLWQHLRDHPINAGVSVPLHDVGSGRYGAFSVIQFGQAERLASWLAAHLFGLCAAAFAFHLAVRREADATPSAPLSQSEAERLALVARGFTSKKIARRLALSSKAVDLHLARACRRLGVATRAQAVPRAIAGGRLRLPPVPADPH